MASTGARHSVMARRLLTLEQSLASASSLRPYTYRTVPSMTLQLKKHAQKNAPWILVGRLPDLGLHFTHIQHNILSLSIPHGHRRQQPAIQKQYDSAWVTYLVIHALDIIHRDLGELGA